MRRGSGALEIFWVRLHTMVVAHECGPGALVFRCRKAPWVGAAFSNGEKGHGVGGECGFENAVVWAAAEWRISGVTESDRWDLLKD